MHETNRNFTIEILSGTTVTKLNLSIFLNRHTCPFFSIVLICQEIIHHFRIKNIFVFLLKILEWCIYIIVCQFQGIHDVNLVCTIKYRCCNIETKDFRCQTQMNLKHLSDIHSGRHTQRIQHDVKRTSVWQKWHIFNRQYTGNDTLVTMTTSHLIADLNFSLLCNINAHGLIYTR